MATIQLTGTIPPPASSAPVDPLAGVTLLNPDGISPEAAAKGVRLTPKALRRIRAAMAKEGVSPEQGGLRLGIQGGGCSGLSYNIRFETAERQRDRTFLFDDGTAQPIRIFIDPKSFIYLTGMVLDFEETLMRQGFNFINPNSTKSCGCGSSFSA
ncbi:MAG TPA: iron-sulfur cluster assembly accessory protein [Granulicella sp.]